MGKVEDMRALRQQLREGAATRAARPAAPASVPGSRARVAPPPPDDVVVDEAPAVVALCGHTAIGGKRCVRAKDHSEKNHRYAKTVQRP